jgi:hypothetical protein
MPDLQSEAKIMQGSALDLTIKYAAVLTFLLLAAGTVRTAAYNWAFYIPGVEAAFLPASRTLSSGVLILVELATGPAIALACFRLSELYARPFRKAALLVPGVLAIAYHTVFYTMGSRSDRIGHGVALLVGSYIILIVARSQKATPSLREYELAVGIVFFITLVLMAQYRGAIDALIFAASAPNYRLLVSAEATPSAAALGLKFSTTSAPTLSDAVTVVFLSDRVCYIRLPDGAIFGINRDKISILATHE